MLIHEVVTYLSALIEDKQQNVQIKARTDLLIRADRSMVRQALINLLDNAIKYSPAGSEILIAARQEKKRPSLR
jgi:signal transduction histidine kinase